jgi:hypothetical protein
MVVVLAVSLLLPDPCFLAIYGNQVTLPGETGAPFLPDPSYVSPDAQDVIRLCSRLNYPPFSFLFFLLFLSCVFLFYGCLLLLDTMDNR